VTGRSYFGMLLAVIVFGIFALYIHKGGALTAVAGLTFGGGLLFCGILIDPQDFKDVLNTLRGRTPPYPPLPGGPEGTFPTGGDK
jgi:hypothetical protein